MFEIPREKTRKGWSVPLAMMAESLVVAFIVMHATSVTHVQAPVLMSKLIWLAPPPPPPPAPPAARRQPVKIAPRTFDLSKLKSPVIIPVKETKLNATLPDMPDAPELAGVLGGVPGGVPGGVLGGIPGGVLGGLLNAPPPAAPPPPPIVAAVAKPASPSRISVGGHVQSALLLHVVEPPYPPLAKVAHVDGMVTLKAVVGCDGKVKELTLISGPPLLVSAAEAAVRQWIYRPTLLNGVPVEVETDIHITFSFSGGRVGAA
jgi:protein TonB